MKPWQKGYELDYLKGLEENWKEYNIHSLSPFSEMKKNRIANYLDKDMLVIEEDYSYVTNIVTSPSKINMFKGVPIGEKRKGDRVVEKINFDPKKTHDLVKRLSEYEEPTWLLVWKEDIHYNKIAVMSGYEYIGSKFNSFGEIVGVFFKDAPNQFFGGRDHPNKFDGENWTTRPLIEDDTVTGNDPWDHVVDKDAIVSIWEKLVDYGMVENFENHYSNYNEGDSWSAISLRGYSPDSNFITDPEEMNKKWHEKHKDQEFKMQDTELREKFPEVDRLLEWVKTPIHRIRFMKLSPGGGTLERHTDQTDPKVGTQDGKLMRFHWPIRSNPEVVFSVWDGDGYENKTRMAVGTCWYIDIRKPHRAINNGSTDRIHLVVDIEADEELRSRL